MVSASSVWVRFRYGVVAAESQVLPLLDERTRQRIGENARGQFEARRFAASDLSGAVFRFQHDVDIETGQGIFGLRSL
jgi:hypothetical protein